MSLVVSGMPSNDHCCVPGCSHRRKSHPNLSFHPIPADEGRRKRWIVAIRRDEGEHFRVTGNTVVCSEHFTSDSYHSPHLFASAPGVRVSRRLKNDAVPTIFAFKPKHSRPSPAERARDALARQQEYVHKLEIAKLPQFGPLNEVDSLQKSLDESREREASLNALVSTLREEVKVLKKQVFRFNNLREDSSAFQFNTGLSVTAWDSLWTILKPSPENILSSKSVVTESSGRKNRFGAGRKSSLPLEDQLLVTLMRLRLGRLERCLASQFGVHESTISRILDTWLNYLYLRLGLIPIWPEWEVIEASMPKPFQDAYPSTFCIIDATELRCQVPSSLSLQSQHYSNYKSHTTMKGLVGIAPNGSFVFISQLYTGAISDRQLVIQSGLLDLLDDVPAGKSIMADKGFEIQDLLVPSGLLLNIPPFKGPGSLTEKDVQKTQAIAWVRIHVERAIGQVKKRFHIFDNVIPMSMAGTINQMWTVCCLLTNFSGPLISET